MKLLRTSNMSVVKECRTYFGFGMLGVLWKHRVDKLKKKCERLTRYLLQWHYRDTDVKS